MKSRFDIEVVVAFPGDARVVKMSVPAGTTVRQAIERARSHRSMDGIEIDYRDVGIYSLKCDVDRLVSPTDRIEIYRPLAMDPKNRRKLKAKL